MDFDLLNLLAPVKCVVCNRARVLCCSEHIRPEPESVFLQDLRGSSAQRLDETLLKVFSGFKDRSITALKKDLVPLAKSALEHFLRTGERPDCILIPPSSKRAFRKRGFVPIKLVLDAQGTGFRIKNFRAIRELTDQRKLTSADRERNLAGAFQISGIENLKVLLFDDVLTTGASIREMRRAAELAGAHVVGFCVMARRF